MRVFTVHYFSLTVTSFHHKGAQNFYGHSRSTVPTLLMTVNQVHTPMTGMNSTVIFYCFQTIITVGISMCCCMNAVSTITYYMLVVLAEAVAVEAVQWWSLEVVVVVLVVVVMAVVVVVVALAAAAAAAAGANMNETFPLNF